MPYSFIHEELCPACPYNVCVEDRRANPVRGRSTRFRLKQSTAMECTFGEFVPGTESDPASHRTFDEHLAQFRRNALEAGRTLYGEEFGIPSAALAKIEGDVFELLEAAALWNAFSVWNRFMDTSTWGSDLFSVPKRAVATPTRKAAVLKLPRGYDATLLFKPQVRASIQAHEAALRLRGLELGLSAPDIVGVRIPEPMPGGFEPFLHALPDLGTASRATLESMYREVEGTLEGRSFLFAIAIKRTTRIDRLYQPLFEANILKYLIEVVLRGAAFRFHVHLGSFEGADVEGHYNAASLISLIRGGEPARAVDHLYHAERPIEAAQLILDGLPLFPL